MPRPPRSSVTTLTNLALAATALTALVGCSTGEATPEAGRDCLSGAALTLVVPVHAGGSAPGLPAEWDCALDTAIRTAVPISVVTAEGTPQILVKGFVAAVNTSNALVANDDVTAAKNALIATVSTATATSDGNDLLAALALAADLTPGGQIMSLDNGASDSGVVRTVEDGMTTVVDPADVAQLVLDTDACPALAGTRVEMFGLGYQVSPATPISLRQRHHVEHIWQAILEGCGAATELVALPRTGAGPTTAHTATAISPEPDPAMPTASPAASCEAVVPDAVIGFIADQATFTDPQRAAAAIADVAAQLVNCQGQAEVIGTTSSAGTQDGRVALSTARARAVAELLATELDVDLGTINAHGMGFDLTGDICVDDRVAGALDPVLAAANRKVVIRVH